MGIFLGEVMFTPHIRLNKVVWDPSLPPSLLHGALACPYPSRGCNIEVTFTCASGDETVLAADYPWVWGRGRSGFPLS